MLLRRSSGPTDMYVRTVVDTTGMRAGIASFLPAISFCIQAEDGHVCDESSTIAAADL